MVTGVPLCYYSYLHTTIAVASTALAKRRAVKKVLQYSESIAICVAILKSNAISQWYKHISMFLRFFGRPFVKRFAYAIRPLSVCLSVYPVCPLYNVGALWPNGWTDQNETRHAVRPRPGHIVLDGNSALSPQKGGRAPHFRHISVVAK